MDNIKKAIKCPNCQEILESPVLLPCCDSVCKKHITESKEKLIRCGECFMEHDIPPAGFPISKALVTIIESEIDKLDFGHVHSEARRSCQTLDEFLKGVESVLNNPLKPTHEKINELKKIVQKKGEDLKLKIEKEVRELFNKLDEYEKQSDENLSSDGYFKESNKLEKSVKETQSELNSWKETLNKMKLDEHKWRNITNECKQKESNIKLSLDDLRTKYFFIKFDEIESRVKFFEQIDITNQFKYRPLVVHKSSADSAKISTVPKSSLESPRIYLDSKIIVNDWSYKLEELLKSVHLNRQSWVLLYRGSRDGFTSKDFHSRCDGVQDTLTIVKTTSECIFVGFSRAAWSTKDDYVFEKDVFLFSLSNKLKKPMVFTQVTDDLLADKKSIYCGSDCGPCFGSGPDLRISDECDSNTDSSSNLGHTFTHADLAKDKELATTILAGSETFRVSEIEVFQKKFAYVIVRH